MTNVIIANYSRRSTGEDIKPDFLHYDGRVKKRILNIQCHNDIANIFDGALDDALKPCTMLSLPC